MRVVTRLEVSAIIVAVFIVIQFSTQLNLDLD